MGARIVHCIARRDDTYIASVHTAITAKPSDRLPGLALSGRQAARRHIRLVAALNHTM